MITRNQAMKKLEAERVKKDKRKRIIFSGRRIILDWITEIGDLEIHAGGEASGRKLFLIEYFKSKKERNERFMEIMKE